MKRLRYTSSAISIFPPVRRFGPIAISVFLVCFLTGCAEESTPSDAFGNFEAVEVMVSAEAGGRLVQFSVSEGARLSVGAEVAQIDTTSLALQRDLVLAQKRAVRARFPGISTQVDVLMAERAVADRELTRFGQLAMDGAATEKQLDDLRGRIEVIDQRVAAVRSQNAPVFAELDVLDARIDLVDDQIRRARVSNPIEGTVVATYSEQDELTAPGRPLYRIARMDTLELRAYVAGSQLADLRLGAEVDVLVDGSDGQLVSTSGVVSWVSAQAEFTPKLIQTREERVGLVYAFKVRVPNPDGLLKVGMPGEVVFNATN